MSEKMSRFGKNGFNFCNFSYLERASLDQVLDIVIEVEVLILNKSYIFGRLFCTRCLGTKMVGNTVGKMIWTNDQ